MAIPERFTLYEGVYVLTFAQKGGVVPGTNLDNFYVSRDHGNFFKYTRIINVHNSRDSLFSPDPGDPREPSSRRFQVPGGPGPRARVWSDPRVFEIEKGIAVLRRNRKIILDYIKCQYV